MDFLTFKSFISTDVLILFYYMGAVIMPLFIWFFSSWFMQKFDFIKEKHKKGKKLIWNSLSRSQKTKLILCFTFCFLFMQLLWRMMFEFLIAYMQIRDALVN